jgi:Ca2+-transporting ATPase
MCEIFKAFTMRSLEGNIFKLKTHNKVLWITLVVSLIMTLSVIYVPFLSDMFSLAPLTIGELAVSLGLAIMVIPVVETVKAIQRKIT